MAAAERAIPRPVATVRVPEGRGFFEGIPLSFVPSSERRRFISPCLKHTAGHELNHALTAIDLGVAVVYVSVVPAGDSLGRILLAGGSTEAYKVIAAAGSHPTHDGSAHGYGSDLAKAHMIAHFHGGSSVDGAKATAAGILDKYDPKVREIAAEILAFLGEVPGSMITQIIQRAEFEVAYEKEGKSFIIDEGMIHDDRYEVLAPDMSSGEYTRIDDLGKNTYGVATIIDGVTVKKIIVCGLCAGENGHADTCTTMLKKYEFVRSINPNMKITKGEIILTGDKRFGEIVVFVNKEPKTKNL